MYEESGTKRQEVVCVYHRQLVTLLSSEASEGMKMDTIFCRGCQEDAAWRALAYKLEDPPDPARGVRGGTGSHGCPLTSCVHNGPHPAYITHTCNNKFEKNHKKMACAF